MIIGQIPSRSQLKCLEKTKEGENSLISPELTKKYPTLCDVVSACLITDPTIRPTIQFIEDFLKNSSGFCLAEESNSSACSLKEKEETLYSIPFKEKKFEEIEKIRFKGYTLQFKIIDDSTLKGKVNNKYFRVKMIL